MPKLKYEATNYKKLESLQVVHVPVLLGSCRLKMPFFHYLYGDLIHATVLSYGGERISRLGKEKSRERASEC